MNKENLLWILLGIVVGYLAWEEFSPKRCTRCGRSNTTGSITVTPNNRNFPPIKHCGCGG
jgi:hypothetical protein